MCLKFNVTASPMLLFAKSGKSFCIQPPFYLNLYLNLQCQVLQKRCLNAILLFPPLLDISSPYSNLVFKKSGGGGRSMLCSVASLPPTQEQPELSGAGLRICGVLIKVFWPIYSCQVSVSVGQ